MIQGYPLASVSNRLKIWSPRPKHKQTHICDTNWAQCSLPLDTLLKLVKFINQACTSYNLTYLAYKIRKIVDKDNI